MMSNADFAADCEGGDSGGSNECQDQAATPLCRTALTDKNSALAFFFAAIRANPLCTEWWKTSLDSSGFHQKSLI